MFDYYCGIDPGADGAIVVLDKGGTYQCHSKLPTLEIIKNKKTRRIINAHSLAAYLDHLNSTYKNTLFILEQVGAMPKQGVTSMFSMGRGLGIIEGVLAALKCRQHFLMPNDWKKTLLRGLDKEKDASVVVGLRLFPHLQSIMVTPRGRRDHNIADALLMAEWARQYYSKTSQSECSASLLDLRQHELSLEEGAARQQSASPMKLVHS